MNEVREIFSRLVDLQLLRSRNFCGTRDFYFGHADSKTGRKEVFSLLIESEWRIEVGEQILTGSSDYLAKADNNADPAWEEGMPWGHLQGQKLREFMGAATETDIIARRQILVASSDVDAVGGFQIRFSEGAILAAFPASCREMEWMLKGTDGSCAMWINGVLNYHGPRA